jgi:hypothetical protein
MAHPPDFSTEERYIVYCDESRHVQGDSNPYMGIGGLWVPYQQKASFRRRLEAVAAAHELRGELKWQKVSEKSLPGYKAIVDAFAEHADLRFRAIIVDHKAVDYTQFHRGDEELGFYSFYYHMLVKWIHPDTSYIIILDHKINAKRGRYSALEARLRQSAPVTSEIRMVTVADSMESRLAQLADVLTGAVTAAWSGTLKDSPKGVLQEYIAARVGAKSLTTLSPLPTFSKFNIFQIQLAQPVGR